MQIVKYDIDDNILTVGFKEDNFVVYSIIEYNKNLSKKELLKQAYMQCKDAIEYERTLEEHLITTDEIGEEFILEDSKAIKLEVDFDNLKGKVLDQYVNVFSTDIIFSVEGSDKVSIKNNKIIEESVLIDTDYFIVAKYGDLIEKQQNTIYAPKVVKENVDKEKVAMAEAIVDLNSEIEILKKEIELLKGGK
ncbi:hypothetical protein [Clostridium ihumii]|uniref:hypothetical protein n=1 Tax=Clostridium ihumii TaxID=1470356 RepID=UPI00054DE8ED|nr:hypothetical protein [Clostridium ihumii]